MYKKKTAGQLVLIDENEHGVLLSSALRLMFARVPFDRLLFAEAEKNTTDRRERKKNTPVLT